MKKTLFILCMGMLLLSACNNPNYLLYERDIIKDHIWDIENAIVYEVDNNVDEAKHEIVLLIRHAPFYPLDKLPIYFTEIRPDGNKASRFYDVPIRTKSGEFKGECHGDLCDIEVYIMPEYYFSHNGTYRYEIRHEAKQNPKLNGVLSVGLLIRTPEEEQ